MSDILVTWYSRTGSTESVARALAERLGADAEPILAQASYDGAGGFMRGIWESLRRKAPPVQIGADPARYSLVVVGAPVWAGRPAAPVRAFLRRHGPRSRSLAAFCLSGSGGAYPEAFAEIETLAGHPLVARLTLSQQKALSMEAGPVLDAFARQLKTRRAAAA
jgi:hypothetical protein